MRNYLLIISPLVLLVNALAPDFLQPLGIGQQCYIFASISGVSLVADPWPITAGVNVKVELSGNLEKDESIGDVIVTQSIGTTSSKQNVTVNAAFAKGSLFDFKYSFTAPTSSGNYNEKFQVMQNVSQSLLLCWQFSYII